jgi:hypothetical protein
MPPKPVLLLTDENHNSASVFYERCMASIPFTLKQYPVAKYGPWADATMDLLALVNLGQSDTCICGGIINSYLHFLKEQGGATNFASMPVEFRLVDCMPTMGPL